ncbi:MAG: DUF885 domain-containing protein [Candidatus Acetothermia bacterium]|jgi:uncharacterized protein (DUF885 family)|nr:DUF885 domain-containing protein [Candidatus Acetothermia bacterium]MDH7504974.1 DUF885 domain-containing protein [Candidatus Acetothermia bacterium]
MANNPSEAEFYERANAFIDRLLKEAPVVATQLGDHRFDDRLADYDRASLARQEREVREALAEFGLFEPEGFDVDAKIDHRLMVQIARSILRGFEKFKGHLRNPSMYSDECLSGVFLLLIREFAPLEERLEKVLGRLRAIPEVLSQGKENLNPGEVPPVWCEVALESSRQGLKLFTMLIPLLSLKTPRLAPRLILANRRAAAALKDYIKFLEREVLPQAKGQFAVGKELFEELLRENHMLDYTAEELLQTGWQLFEETKQQMEKLARELDPKKSAKQLLEAAKADHPKAEELLEVYRWEMARAREFVRAHEIATIPAGESLKVEATPPFLRGIIPYAAYMMPGPLERVQQGIFLVTPVDPKSSKKEQEEKLKGHNWAKLPVTALHEAYPGHHLQLVYANKVGSLPRKLGTFISTLFIEGWAFYCEELMERLGYIAEPLQRLGRLNDQLWRAARIVLDASLYTGKMTVAEGINLLVDRVGLERSNALAEVRRYTLSPTQPMSYLIGKLEILKLIEEYKKRHPNASLREVHDAVLSCGSLPPRLMRERLLAD